MGKKYRTRSHVTALTTKASHTTLRTAARAEISLLDAAWAANGSADESRCACGLRLSRADAGGVCVHCRAEAFRLKMTERREGQRR